MNDPSCYVCGHAPEEHRDGYAECEYDDGDGNGCAVECIYFEAREEEEVVSDREALDRETDRLMDNSQ
ncbi:hypothetical protein LCGC14_1069810 [marine sediment metagenome]|uniref:Uncharacterized protein n=1 Tax=marine sediment metagenome TaxID=412755 RepID=A0A0F9N5N6_9ZZZZ